jgi:hypothetical protein
VVLLVVVAQSSAGRVQSSDGAWSRDWLRVQRLLGQRKLQEAEWALRRRGKHQRADQLQRRVEAILSHGRVLQVRHFRPGTMSTLKQVDLEGGITALFKREGPDSRDGGDQAPRKEIAAWRIDRLLQLGVVPVTVRRTIHGERGSAQYFVRDVQSGDSLGMHSWNVSRTVQFLDALLANWDRHPGNFLIDRAGRHIAIDHNLAFDEGRYVRPGDQLRLVPSRRVYQNLKALEDVRLRNELADFLAPHELDGLVRRKRELIQLLDQVTDEGRRAGVFDD